MNPDIPHVPQQARSKATLNRICRAASDLLERRPWHEISVAQIARKANSSVGSFYARFPDKDSLLDHLDQLYAQDVMAMVSQLHNASSQLSLDNLVSDLVTSLVQFHGARPGLIRALVLRARMFREKNYDARTKTMNRGVREILTILSQRLESSHGDPEKTAFLSFSFMFSALRDRILFPETVENPYPLTETQIAAELTKSMLAIIQADKKTNSEL